MRRRLLELVGDRLFLAHHAGNARVGRRCGAENLDLWHVCLPLIRGRRTSLARRARLAAAMQYFTHWLSVVPWRNLSSGQNRMLHGLADYRTATMNRRG